MGEAKTTHQLGLTANLQGDLEAAKVWYARAIALFEQLGDEGNAAKTKKLLDYLTNYERQGSHEGHAGPCAHSKN